MSTLYLIPGLGVDERIFSKLHVPGYNLVYLNWIVPYKDETLSSYAIRLASQIDTSKPFYLLGVSFGGMIAVEIAKKLKPQKTIIISSTATTAEIPWYLRIAAWFHLDYILPATVLKSANPISYWIFGTSLAEEKHLLKQVLSDIDPKFMKWALRAIARWRNIDVPDNLVRIHGTNDRVLPMCNDTKLIRIEDGGHLMIYNNAAELSSLIVEHLSSL